MTEEEIRRRAMRRGMTQSAHALPVGPSKDDLRRMLAEAWRNTTTTPDGPAVIRERTPERSALLNQTESFAREKGLA